MAISTYAELKTSVAAWLHRQDLTTIIPDFITLCEASMQRDLNVGEQELTATLTLAQNASSITLPSGFQKVRRIRYMYGDVYYDLFPVALAPSYSDGVTPRPPGLLSFQGDTITVHSPADQPYTFVIDYYGKFTPLSDANQTNWILTDHPDAYLYGALMQSAPYLGTDNRIELWSNAFVGILEEIKRLDFKRRNSQLQLVSDVAWAGRARWGSGNGRYNW